MLDPQEYNQTDLTHNLYNIQYPEEGSSGIAGNNLCQESMSSMNILQLNCKSPSKQIHLVVLHHQCEGLGDILQAGNILGGRYDLQKQIHLNVKLTLWD
jgi:hypothetical protein